MKIKKEKKDKKAVKPKTKTPKKMVRFPRPPPPTPPAADNEDLVGDLFRSITENEDQLLADFPAPPSEPTVLLKLRIKHGSKISSRSPIF